MMLALVVFLGCAIAAGRAQEPNYSAYGRAPAPPAPTGIDGTVVDTPEVAQAKAAHFAEFARAAARAAEDKSSAGGQPGGPPAYSSQYHHPAPVAVGPPAGYAAYSTGPSAGPPPPPPPPPASSYGHASYGPGPYQPQAQSAHHQPAAYHHFAGQPDKGYGLAPSGPSAKVPFVPAPLAEDGTVLDTPEVAALKAARLQELAAAEARAAKYGNDEYAVEGQGQYQPGPPSGQYRPAYAGPAGPSYAPAGRAYQPSAPVYQPQPAYPGQPQSYQSQY